MPHVLLLAALFLLIAPAGSASSGERSGAYESRSWSAQTRERARKRDSAKYERSQRRHAERSRYSYRYTRWWGPFAGPPGL